MLVRLSKLMSARGICSRREADRYIAAGQVKVNGQVVDELGTKVAEDAEIELSEKAFEQQRSKVTIMLNKPLGIVSTQPEKGYQEALSLITPDNQWGGGPKLKPEHLQDIGVIGRLDIESKGLLLFTQDGVLARSIIGEGEKVEKEYLVRVEGEITESVLKQLRYGLQLDGEQLKPAKVREMQPQLLQMVLTQGKKRQIRRMCELVGLTVAKLKRVRIGQLPLGDLPEGMWRFVDYDEAIV